MAETINNRLNILLIEDDNDDIVFFSEAVEKIGNVKELTVAKDCGELFNHFENKNNLDLIFLDINLPLVDGKECLKQIKTSAYKNVPVIMFTGSNAQPDIDEVYENGAHYYVIKPYAHSNYLASLKIIFSHNWKQEQPRPLKENFVVNLTFN